MSKVEIIPILQGFLLGLSVSSGYILISLKILCSLLPGLQTSEDAKCYALSTRLKPFSNENETLVVQFSAKHEQNVDCGGRYVKLFPDTLNQEDIHSESEYYTMFSPDICGFGNNKVQVILHYQGKYHENNKTIKWGKDNPFNLIFNNKQVAAGDREGSWDFLPPRKIKDPCDRKPRTWDECLQIEDPEDSKPEDFEYMPDPDAKKPDDWNEAIDGVWEGPLIPNLKYKGQWKPRIIGNPNYQGEWIHPEIDNPKYKPDPTICRYYNISALGLDLWQVKSGSIFDNFLLTNDEEFAKEVGNKTWEIRIVRYSPTLNSRCLTPHLYTVLCILKVSFTIIVSFCWAHGPVCAGVGWKE
uniref:Calreticulin n=1 Tax=Rhinolophus ferrumequinum TaxID=59479 RepID=A0A671E2L6_RHIFE